MNTRENNSNTTPDSFDKIFRQKLYNHELPVEENTWFEIENRLKKKKKRNVIPFWLWTASGMAAAVLLLLFVFQNFQHQNLIPNQPVKVEVQSTPQHQLQKNDQLLSKKLTKKPIIVEYKKTNRKHSVTHIPKKEPVTNSSVVIAEVKTKSDSTTQVSLADNKIKTAKTQTNNFSTINNDHTTRSLAVNDKPAKKPYVNKHNHHWEMSASLSTTAGNFGDNPGGGDLLAGNSGNKILTTLKPSDFSNRTYAVPLGFSILVSRNLSQSLILETGITYSFLSTNFTNSYASASLDLHYLGIPVNLIAPIWKKNNWSIYGGAGGMIEKGIQSIYAQHITIADKAYNTTTYESIDGFQWSMHVSGGANYSIAKKANLYIEPELSYFFDSNQPISIRTDKKWILNLVFGIKFKL